MEIPDIGRMSDNLKLVIRIGGVYRERKGEAFPSMPRARYDSASPVWWSPQFAIGGLEVYHFRWITRIVRTVEVIVNVCI